MICVQKGAMETFTLVVWLYVGGGRHEATYTRNLSQGDCRALAEEVERTQPGATAYCSRWGRLCADCGPLLGRRRL